MAVFAIFMLFLVVFNLGTFTSSIPRAFVTVTLVLEERGLLEAIPLSCYIDLSIASDCSLLYIEDGVCFGDCYLLFSSYYFFNTFID